MGADRLIRDRTGLPVDPYFSGTKLAWLLDNVPEARKLAERGDLLGGTTDAWFLWQLTGEHRTDDSTASRTMLYNPRTRDWDDDILQLLNLPRCILPAIQPSCSNFGSASVFGRSVSIAASVVDQQAGLFGQACHTPGDTKVTYGTGAFILLNAGDRFPTSKHGLLPTVAWSIGNQVTYALDGGIYVAGAAIQWLRDELGVIRTSEEAEAVEASSLSRRSLVWQLRTGTVMRAGQLLVLLGEAHERTSSERRWRVLPFGRATWWTRCRTMSGIRYAASR
jgi:glycerol kinase